MINNLTKECKFEIVNLSMSEPNCINMVISFVRVIIIQL